MVLTLAYTFAFLVLVLLIPGEFASLKNPDFSDFILIIVMGFSYFVGFFSMAKGSEINKN